MSSAGFYLLVFLLALAAYLAARSVREGSPPGGGPPETPGLLSDVFFNLAKWVAILSFLGFFLPALLMAWPPRWIERRDQRKEVLRRVAEAGGWSALVSDTQALLATNTYPIVRVRPPFDTNFILSPSVAALKPRDIELNPLSGSSAALFHIFGFKSTGWRGQANYWLLIMDKKSEPAVLDSTRSRFQSARTIHEVTNGVFEIY